MDWFFVLLPFCLVAFVLTIVMAEKASYEHARELANQRSRAQRELLERNIDEFRERRKSIRERNARLKKGES